MQTRVMRAIWMERERERVRNRDLCVELNEATYFDQRPKSRRRESEREREREIVARDWSFGACGSRSIGGAPGDTHR